MYNLYAHAPVLPIRSTVVSSWRSVKCMEVVAKNDGEKEEMRQMIERKTDMCERKKRYREMERQRNIVIKI